MKKSTINTMTIITSVISLYILVFKGFGFPNISPLLDYLLRFLAALCVQVFVVFNFRTIWIRIVPMALTALFMLWVGSRFMRSDSWQGVRFAVYFAEYCTPFLGCCAAWLICKVNSAKD